MRIVHLSTNDQRGGAARAAYRLHRGLLRLGLDSRMLVLNRDSDDPNVAAVKRPRALPARLRQGLRAHQIRRSFAPYKLTRPRGLEPFSDDRTRFGADLLGQIPPCDAITLHYVASLLDLPAFFGAAPARTPVIWRLSDMNAFTGGCHYDEECGRYAQQCGACPQLGSHDPRDLSFQIWERKRAAYRAVPPGRLHIVALNRWMADSVRRSSLLADVPVTIIPNGLDTAEYAPRDKASARDVLGIPQSARVVLFVAASLENRRKGFAQLAQALAGIQAEIPDIFLVAIGKGTPPIDPAIPHLVLGPLSQDRLLSMVYSAADLFVIPSLQDNQPSTVLESLACGTPVVGFAAGGIVEMVRPGQTGALAPVGDVAGLHAAMVELLANDEHRRRLGENCRRIALEEYAQEIQARRYAELYATICATSGAAQPLPA